MEYSKWLTVVILIIFSKYSTGELDVADVLKNVPKEELPDFIQYYAMLGYELSSGNKEKSPSDVNTNKGVSDLDAVSDFAVNLYEWLIENYKINPQMRSFPRRPMCFPSGMCVDIGDVGVHP